MKKIILISGKAGHGKDESANFLKTFLEQQGNKVTILHFASHIKQILKEMYNWNGIKDEWARDKLQWLGTERIRHELAMPNFHVNRTCENILIAKNDFDYFIIPDCRFLNEIDIPKQLFGNKNVVAIRVVRTGYISQLTEQAQLHESEVALDDYNEWDYISYSHDLDGCETNMKEICTQITA